LLSSSEFLLKCEDETESNILHYLAAIVKKHNSGKMISEKDWEVFNELLLIDENLKNLENYSGRTPEDIITEATNLTLTERIVYSIS
jgi:hypothetical protein